jgi:hypothetical protein
MKQRKMEKAGNSEKITKNRVRGKGNNINYTVFQLTRNTFLHAFTCSEINLGRL